MHPTEGQIAYVCICQGKGLRTMCIYSKTLTGKGLSQESQMESKNRLSSNHVTRKLRITERKSRTTHSKTQKRRSIPSMVDNYVMRKISLWHRVNKNRPNDTHKSNLI
jgi:CRISPR/Cas system-associated protein endoribonuclease Cas2